MEIAKVNKKTMIVEDTNVVSQKWLDENPSDEYIYVIMSSSDTPHIGLSWSEENGFEQPN